MTDKHVHSPEKVLGVLGGMGPEATVDFMDKLVSATPAEVDQDHIETVVYNDPKIPDRNSAILNGSESPLPRLVRNMQRLENIGADVLAAPCNTAHYYFEELNTKTNADFINMVTEARRELEAADIESAGLLATETVMETGVYANEFVNSSVDLIEPDSRDSLMECIYDIKQKHHLRAQKSFDIVIDELESKGVEALIVGCTDLALLEVRSEARVFDTTTILAEACIERMKP